MAPIVKLKAAPVIPYVGTSIKYNKMRGTFDARPKVKTFL